MITLVRTARRRLFCNELLAQGANAASAALAAFILLLLFGTQILNWQWLVFIPLAAALLGFYRARKRLPGPYEVAQQIDRRLSLADTLSTAVFFSQPPPAATASAEIRRFQFEAAERTAASVDVRRAMPYRMPRTAYGMAALMLVATSLFALRYGLSRRIDLKPPLARMIQQNLSFGAKTEQARANRRTPPPPDSQSEDSMDESAIDRDRESGDQQNADIPDQAEQGMLTQAGKGEKKTAEASEKQSDQGEQGEEGGENAQGDERQGENGENANQGQQGKPDSKRDSGSKQDGNNATENSSLMSKVKDAMQNLLSRMKPQPGQSGQQQGSQEQNGKQGKGQQNGGKQQSAKDGQKQAGDQQGESQDGEPGEQAQNAQDQQGKGTGKNDAQQASKQPGSGIGSQDGDKNIKRAEQLAAMGKISEIIGKRSANITGETTVEVQNTSQTLRTPYAQRGAQHSQGGTEISRDEIPVALQGYVAQYFEQVRKQAPSAAPAKK